MYLVFCLKTFPLCISIYSIPVLQLDTYNAYGTLARFQPAGSLIVFHQTRDAPHHFQPIRNRLFHSILNLFKQTRGVAWSHAYRLCKCKFAYVDVHVYVCICIYARHGL